jgi:hypothetical protein
MKFIKKILFTIGIAVLLTSCGIYSFSGTSTNAKTIRVIRFENTGGGGPPSLSQKITEDLKTYYLQNTRLSVVNAEADLLVEGEITTYQIAPLAPTADQIASQTRLTISMKVRFTNVLDDKEDFEQVFTQYADFAATSTLSQVETGLVQQISDKLVFDIFQKTVANW